MSRALLLAAATLSLLLLQETPRASAQEVADASCSGTVNFIGTGSGASRFAESFTAQHSGTLTRAQIGVYETGSGGDWILQILGVTAGAPVNGVLGSATIPDATVPAGSSTAEAGFTPAPPVTAGQQYALVVTRPGSGLVGAQIDTTDPCPGGEMYSSGPAPSAFTSDAPNDLIFSVFVTPPPVLAPTPPAATGQRAAALKKCKKKKSKKARKKCKKKARKLPV